MINKLPRAFALRIAMILLVTPLAARSQDDVRLQQIGQVRALVQSFGPRPTKVALLTRQLIVTRGKIVRSRETSFDLKHNDGVTTIFYESVLELESKKGSVSFVPDRAAKNHGAWEDVGRIYPGTKIIVLYSDGRSAKGFSNSTSKTCCITGRNNPDDALP